MEQSAAGIKAKGEAEAAAIQAKGLAEAEAMEKKAEAMDHLKKQYPEIRDIVQIRVIQVVDSKITKEQCLDYIHELKEIGIKQITFRQMFGNKKAYKYFKELKDEIHKDGVMFLKDGEYHNYYFTTTNELFPYFFGNSEADRFKWMKFYEDLEQSCN